MRLMTWQARRKHDIESHPILKTRVRNAVVDWASTILQSLGDGGGDGAGAAGGGGGGRHGRSGARAGYGGSG